MTLHEWVRQYQDSKDCDDASMVQILCDLLDRGGMSPAVKEALEKDDE